MMCCGESLGVDEGDAAVSQLFRVGRVISADDGHAVVASGERPEVRKALAKSGRSGGRDHDCVPVNDDHPVARRLARLADDQRAAATAPPGPVLCVAPAGSGKTTTVVARLAWHAPMPPSIHLVF